MHDGKPSATALLIAKSQLLLAGDPASASEIGVGRADYYRSFVEAAAGGPWRPGAASRLLLRLTDRISIPGIHRHYAWRKRCIEQIARDFLTAAPRTAQVVVIAAGFDPLAAMLSREYGDAAFIELDHPATQRCKRAAFEKLNHGNNNPALLPVDLARESIAGVLDTAIAFSPRKRTLFIAEGITMYLECDGVGSMFRQLSSHALHEGNMLCFTYMNRQPSGSIQFENATALVDWWLRLKGEPFKWGIGRGDLPAFLDSTGWRLVDVIEPDRGGTGTKGENICVAAMGGDRDKQAPCG